MNSLKLQHRVALITGAGRGIGRAIAFGFAREGASIVATARSESDLRATVDEITAHGGSAFLLPADLMLSETPSLLVHEAERVFGQVDILVNNAGIGSAAGPAPVVSFNDELWDRTLALNLTVPYRLCKAALPGMLQRKHGRIVNISSIAGKIGSYHGAAYAASKHGLLGLTRSLALETAASGVTVNAICPGPVHTEMSDIRIRYDVDRLGASFDEYIRRLTPIGRRLEPEEIVSTAILLAGDESAAITGQAYNVCGGVLMAV
jgi:NAD(P)-dependent dehydrogenase (short-subunit alcohol dehydrogenase family)